jgi:hypothetical protein
LYFTQIIYKTTITTMKNLSLTIAIGLLTLGTVTLQSQQATQAEVTVKPDIFKSVCGVVDGREMYKYPCQVVDQYNGKTKARTILRYPDMELVLVWLPGGKVEVSGSAGGNSEPETVSYTVKSGETNFTTKKASYFYMSDKKVAARELSQLQN